MAVWTFEQGIGNAGTEPLAYALNVKSGSLLVVTQAFTPGTLNPVAPTDTRGTSYSQIRKLNDATNGNGSAWWWGISPGAGANSVNFDATGASFAAYMVAEFSVDTGTISLEAEIGQVQASNTNATDNVTSTSVTTLGTDRLIVGWFEDSNNGLVSSAAGTGFVERVATNLSGLTNNHVKMESQTLAAAGSVAGTWTVNTNMSGAVVYVAAFKAVAAGAPGVWSPPSLPVPWDYEYSRG